MLTEEVKKRIQSAYTQWLNSKNLKPRYGQRLMLAEIAKTLASADKNADIEDHDAPICVVEAGTGTGKTIAYLLAGIPVAQYYEKTLVIATATVALQEQIVNKDLPDVQNNSGLPVNFTLAKGRGRYVCLSKLDTLLQDGAQDTMGLYPDEESSVIATDEVDLYNDMINQLADGSWDGERDSWPQELETKAWQRVTTDHAQCSGRRCSYINQCSFFKAREQINKVDVIVANHDLVLADLALGGGAILPPTDECIFIFDEGHHLPDKTIDHFAQFSRIRSTERWLDQAAKAVASSAPAITHSSTSEYLQELPPLIETAKQQTAMLFNYLQSLLEAKEESSSRDSFNEFTVCRFEEGVVPEELSAQSENLALSFRDMEGRLGKLCSILDEAMEDGYHSISQATAEVWFPVLSSMRLRTENNLMLWQDYASAIEAEEPPRSRWVSYVENIAGVDIEVASSPIIASGTLQHYLWSRCYGALVTSATLSSLNKFDRFAMRAGIPKRAKFATVPSPFDYQNAELVVPAMPCEPSDNQGHTNYIIDELPSMLKHNLGALVLFSSRRQMLDVYDGLDEKWRKKVICQGDSSKQEIISKHKKAIDKKQQSVIFGLASFAEGVDLPGDYCSHVVIAKIPFAVPDQPVEAALAEWIESRGGNPFMDISVPDAATRLVQACGRLLRTETDEGTISLLDKRVITKRYGGLMLNSLPPFKRVINK